MVNLTAVMTLLLTSGLHRCKQRTFKKNSNYFYSVRISISLAIFNEISSQIGYFLKFFPKSYATKVGAFAEHSVQSY